MLWPCFLDLQPLNLQYCRQIEQCGFCICIWQAEIPWVVFWKKPFLSPLKQLFHWQIQRWIGTSERFIQNLCSKHSSKSWRKHKNVFIFYAFMASYWVRIRKCSEQRASAVYLQKEIPAWPSLFNRLLLSQFLIREAHREKKDESFSCCNTLIKSAAVTHISY